MSGSVELEKFIDRLIEQAGTKGYVPKIFIDMRHSHGTVEAMKILVSSRKMHKGLRQLADIGLLELSIEAAVLKFPDEFTTEERAAAKWKLEQMGYKVAENETNNETNDATDDEVKDSAKYAAGDKVGGTDKDAAQYEAKDTDQNVKRRDDKKKTEKAPETKNTLPNSNPSSTLPYIFSGGFSLLIAVGFGLLNLESEILKRIGVILLVASVFLAAAFLFWTYKSWIDQFKVFLIISTLMLGVQATICLVVGIFCYIVWGEGYGWLMSSAGLWVFFFVFLFIVNSFENKVRALFFKTLEKIWNVIFCRKC